MIGNAGANLKNEETVAEHSIGGPAANQCFEVQLNVCG
jgi:hypothetical protein